MLFQLFIPKDSFCFFLRHIYWFIYQLYIFGVYIVYIPSEGFVFIFAILNQDELKNSQLICQK